MSFSKNTFLDIFSQFRDNYLRNSSVQKAVLVTVAVFAFKKTINHLQANLQHKRLVEKAKLKRSERDNIIKEHLISLPEIPQDITLLVLNAKVHELLELLNEEKITSEQILIIYYKRAITLGLKLELIAESNFTESLETARKYDTIRKNTPKEERHKLGSLYGIPICIKDSIEQKGLDSTCGRARSCFAPCKNDGAIITFLRSQGAIPFIRSNLSQILRAFDCSNNIWGVGLNPWNTNRTVGGSSGGDGGLIAAKCSPIGFGSDAFGSIRVPAAFNGVYGFKPTSGRLARAGHTLISFYDIAKFSFLQASNGPLGRCTEDLVTLLKGVIVPESRLVDPSVPFVAWNDEKYLSKNKLKIGYVLSEDLFEASAPCKRAVKEAVKALKSQGHEVVEIKIPRFEEIILTAFRLLTLEGESRGLKQALGGEKPDKGLELFYKIGEISNGFKRILKWFSGSRINKILDSTVEVSANEVVLSFSKMAALRAEFLGYWSSNKFDAILTPAVALPAFKHGYGSKLLFATCYLWLANIVNTPAGIVPVTKVQEHETHYTNSTYPNDILTKYSQENMEGSTGLPVGVQVLTLPWEDEKCLRVMKEIEDVIKFYENKEI